MVYNSRLALITGITGQDGAYLARLLLDKNYRVMGLVRSLDSSHTWRLNRLDIVDDVELLNIDLLDQLGLARLFHAYCFDEVYNLAGQSSVAASYDAPIITTDINAIAPLYLLEIIKQYSPNTRIYQASSSDMWGSNNAAFLHEGEAFKPISPYGIAKLFAHNHVELYRNKHNIFAVSGITANHESSLRSKEFVTAKIIAAAGELKSDNEDLVSPLYIGNLDASRDWGWAPEYVVGMWQAMQHPTPETFVFATGRMTTVREFINRSFKRAGLELGWQGEGVNETGVDSKSGRTLVKVDSRFYRPGECTSSRIVARKAKRELGWISKVGVDGLIDKMLNNL